MTDDTPRPKLICLDFDGVIHSYTSGWKGATEIPDKPVPGAMEFIDNILRDDRFALAIYSSRSGQAGGIEAMQAWLYLWLVARLENDKDSAWNAVKTDIQWPTEKPPATVSIDDRALTFTGEWPPLSKLANFQPWNKLKELPPLRPLSRETYKEICNRFSTINNILKKLSYADAVTAITALEQIREIIDEGLPGHESFGVCEACELPTGVDEAVDVSGEGDIYFCRVCAEEARTELEAVDK